MRVGGGTITRKVHAVDSSYSLVQLRGEFFLGQVLA
jgi:hypothetical protein